MLKSGNILNIILVNGLMIVFTLHKNPTAAADEQCSPLQFGYHDPQPRSSFFEERGFQFVEILKRLFRAQWDESPPKDIILMPQAEYWLSWAAELGGDAFFRAEAPIHGHAEAQIRFLLPADHPQPDHIPFCGPTAADKAKIQSFPHGLHRTHHFPILKNLIHKKSPLTTILCGKGCSISINLP